MCKPSLISKWTDYFSDMWTCGIIVDSENSSTNDFIMNIAILLAAPWQGYNSHTEKLISFKEQLADCTN